MKISIITVCFNSEKTIRDTIESVLSQDYCNIEYIIIDGNSDDNTMNIVSEYSAIDIVVTESDLGIYDAMNKGIQKSSGDVIGILNSDDFFASSEVISSVVSCFYSNLNSDLVFGDLVFIDPLKKHKITRFYSSVRFRSWKLRFGWMPPHPATFIKKSAYDKVGNYSLSYKISADYDLFVRLLLVHKMKFTRMNKLMVKMRAGGVSTLGIKNSLLLNSEIVKACRVNGIYTNIFMVLLKIPMKLFEVLRKTTCVS